MRLQKYSMIISIFIESFPNFVIMNLNKPMKSAHILLGLAFIVISSRLIPHAPNFTGSIAAVIFGAVVLRSWKSLSVILIAYLIADLFINNIQYRQNEFLWISPGFYWILIPLVAIFILNSIVFKKEFTPLGILGSSLFSSTLFFLVTNFAVWISSKVAYTQDLSGLLICYFNALPFFGYELAGTVFYSSVIFSVYWLYFYQLRPDEVKN